MLNLLGAISQFGQMMPGYLQGERMAVQDNWQDLSNYNEVQRGQIQNAFDEAVFDPRVQMLNDQAVLSRMGVGNAQMNYEVNQALQPQRLGEAMRASYQQPLLAPYRNVAELQQLMTTLDMLQNPHKYMGGFGGYYGGYGGGLNALLSMLNGGLYQPSAIGG